MLSSSYYRKQEGRLAFELYPARSAWKHETNNEAHNISLYDWSHKRERGTKKKHPLKIQLLQISTKMCQKKRDAKIFFIFLASVFYQWQSGKCWYYWVASIYLKSSTYLTVASEDKPGVANCFSSAVDSQSEATVHTQKMGSPISEERKRL